MLTVAVSLVLRLNTLEASKGSDETTFEQSHQSLHCSYTQYIMEIYMLKLSDQIIKHLDPLESCACIFKPNGISHCYQLEQSISVLRDVGWYLSFLLKFK